MKVTIIGGGGVRTPQLVNGLMREYKKLNIIEIALYDIDERRLKSMDKIIKEMLDRYYSQHSVDIYHTNNINDAVTGTDYVIFTIRVGNIEARIKDEQIPLKYNVVGQETTGPGGFAMAMRTIPRMYEYAEVIKEKAPNAWILNLTNPSGLITQALLQKGFKRVIGICDSPSGLTEDIANGLNLPQDELWFTYFGLNHLGWIKEVKYQGNNILDDILKNKKALLRHGDAMIEPDLIRKLGVIPNEYLLFYYYNQTIVNKVKNSRISRAQIIKLLNQKLFAELENMGKDDSALDIYQKYINARHGSYMQVETQGLDKDVVNKLWNENKSEVDLEEDEGYATIALSVIEGLSGYNPQNLILNVPNQSSIPGLKDDDVVEINTYVDQNGIHPYVVGSIPEHCSGLLQVVKSYERLVVQASMNNSYATALNALLVHPLVPDVITAEKILDDYIEVHKVYFPDLI